MRSTVDQASQHLQNKWREPPRKIDFVLLAPTSDEERAAQTVLRLPYVYYHKELFRFKWGFLSSRDGARAAVALVTQGEDYGALAAAQLTRAAVRVLAPDYLLIVGHALGLDTDTSQKIEPEDIVISYYLHAGEYRRSTSSVFRSPLRLHRIAHPDDLLVKLACDLSPRFVKARTRGLIDLGARSNVRVIADKEMVCGPELKDQPDDPVVEALVNCFPRIRAYEMESGAVAKTLYDLSREGLRVPGFLLIKGISDCYRYKSVEGEEGLLIADEASLKAANDKERQERRFRASALSAEFAKDLIVEYLSCHPKPRSVVVHRLMPTSARRVFLNLDISGVLHSVTPIDLSEIISFNVRKTEEEGMEGPLVTVCAAEPGELWQTLERLYPGRPVDQNSDTEVQSFLGWTLTQSPHLTTFQDRAPDCSRILLLRSEDSITRIGRRHWELFKAINGDVSCNFLVRDEAPHLRFMTDWTLVGGWLLLDYYFESETLIVTNARSEHVQRELLSLHVAATAGGPDAELFRPITELEEWLETSWEQGDAVI